MNGKKIAILVGGSDLFSGARGVSKGTIIIRDSINLLFDDVLAVNYNYFLDFGRSLSFIKKYLERTGDISQLVLYGYSKGGDVVLQLSRSIEKLRPVNLLVTIDIANGPWSGRINRNVPGNVERNINVFQHHPNILRSCGAATHSVGGTEIKNIDLTDIMINGKKVNHSNIEMLMVQEVINWIVPE